MSRAAVKAIDFDPTTRSLRILDQTKLPQLIEYVNVTNCQDGYHVIKTMMVRGAPCIAAVGCLSLVIELNQPKHLEKDAFPTVDLLITRVIEPQSRYLISSRPTAVNLRNAMSKLLKFCKVSSAVSIEEFISEITEFCAKAVEAGNRMNVRLGDYGAAEITSKSSGYSPNDNGDRLLRILTHCNTGALATVGYGTALGVIRSLHNKAVLGHVYCTETRPYNQGSRLTAWELVAEKIPATLIADSMVASLMAASKIDAVVVGADCVAANGDTANKIGTMQIAIIAKHYGVPFYVAAPIQSIDPSVRGRHEIEIEMRPADEMRRLGDVQLAPSDIDVWNPCFDVTPSEMITGIITEHGVCKPDELLALLKRCAESQSSDDKYAIF